MKKILPLFLLSAAFVMASCGQRQLSSSSHATGLSSSESHATGLTSEEETSHDTGSTSEDTGSTSEEETSHDTSLSSSEESSAIAGYSAMINGVQQAITNLLAEAPDEKGNLAKFAVTLAVGDNLSIFSDGEALHFFSWDETVGEEGAAVDDGVTFTATKEGEHTIWLNGDVQLWVVEPSDTPAEGTTVSLYAKFGISDEEALLPAYAWVWSESVAGTWHYATHVAETWTAANNRHYTFNFEGDYVGMQVILAIFSADSGVSETQVPDETWSGKVKESVAATLADWGADLS